MSERKKIFPLKLPQNFHGKMKNRPSLVQEHKKRLREERNPEDFSPSKKVSTWQRKIYNSDIVRERRQFLVHPSKLSCDVPDWCKTTTNYYQRNQYHPRHKETRAQWERFDVFNRERKISFAEKDQMTLTSNRFSQPIEVTGKVGWEDRARSTTFKEVTPKVGSMEIRDFSVRRPQMKVGKIDFIDTYTPF